MPLDSPATRASRRLIHASHADVATIIEFHHLAHVVGTMGADCSERQAELIVSLVKSSGRVWIVPVAPPENGLQNLSCVKFPRIAWCDG